MTDKPLRIKDWPRFQHFKNRRPPWIKLYVDLLDDLRFFKLPVESKALLPMLWLMASESKTPGQIPDDTEMIAHRLRMTEINVEAALKPLIEQGFIERDIIRISLGYQHDLPETEERQRERHKKPPLPPKAKSVEFFDVRKFLDEASIRLAKKKAPGWDVYALAEVYNEGIRRGQRSIPGNPCAAFPAWCANYTKGKPP